MAKGDFMIRDGDVHVSCEKCKCAYFFNTNTSGVAEVIEMKTLGYAKTCGGTLMFETKAAIDLGQAEKLKSLTMAEDVKS